MSIPRVIATYVGNHEELSSPAASGHAERESGTLSERVALAVTQLSQLPQTQTWVAKLKDSGCEHYKKTQKLKNSDSGCSATQRVARSLRHRNGVCCRSTLVVESGAHTCAQNILIVSVCP